MRGNDSDTDEENFSDGDILAANALTVTIAAEPTYAVTFADGVNPEPPAEPEWTASPAADVKKGQTVTVTYSGPRKVMGVKAEKKAAGKPVATLTAAPTPYGYICVYDEIFETLGTAEGGTLMYKVTTTNVKPTSTEGFSTSNPRGVQNEPSWKNYIWYYIKGDDSHSDSEIFGPIEINVWLM